ncbi:outer membrane lipoprotein-sorting protein [uncultured Eudoraea sp.]|uniref:outer membrane lipoprotein-sorting protein n=1 Tax=uncultured Eudoraea sp. TaxID=1035614 RepID=UPI002638C452|nr:outer membrane lipoprotein-sorting protein [uncultured Eudoraea sp.]
MLNLKFVVLFVAFSLPIMGQNNAEEIFEKAADQLLTENLELSIAIKEIASNGKSKDKQYNVLIGKFGGMEKTKTVVQQPDKLKGITIVITSYPDELGLIEIFTPANGKIRKMKATSKNMELVNSGVSIANYTSKDRDQLSFEFKGNEEFDGKSCYKLQVNDLLDLENGKTEYLIEENTYRILKIIAFNEDGTAKSSTTYSDFQPIGQPKGKIQPMFMVNKDLKKAKHNEIKVLKISARPNLKEENFNIEPVIN